MRRNLLIVLAFPLAVGATALLFDFGNDEAPAIVAALIPVAVFGAVVGRAWTLALPFGWTVLYLAVLRVIDLATGECSICSSDEDWGNYPAFFFVIVTVPVTLALLVGLLTGLAARSLRSRARADRPARRAGTYPDPR